MPLDSRDEAHLGLGLGPEEEGPACDNPSRCLATPFKLIQSQMHVSIVCSMICGRGISFNDGLGWAGPA